MILPDRIFACERLARQCNTRAATNLNTGAEEAGQRFRLTFTGEGGLGFLKNSWFLHDFADFGRRDFT